MRGLKKTKFIFLLFAGFLLVGIFNSTAYTEQMAEKESYQIEDIRRGALLYDNWPIITGKNPAGNHPLYPATSKKSGKSTWRCKECHGWDYIGAEGRYKKGSHYTGIKGIYRARTQKGENLHLRLSTDDHGLSQYLTPTEIWNIVKFIRDGQRDISAVIDENNMAKGSAMLGKPLYNNHCASCHGEDGDKLDFKGNKEGIQGVGWLALKNPQESIHKIRWGHPGSDMPSLIADKALREQDAINILTYSQTLGK